VRIATLYRRSLAYHWRTNLATTLCVVAAGAVLTGALVVGDSMRESLRDLALRRLGPVTHALNAGRFFGDELATHLAADKDFETSGARACPLILLQGSIEHVGTGERVNQVNLLGIDRRFSQLTQSQGSSANTSGPDRSVILNELLARALHVRPGEDILVHLGSQSAVPVETLLGRRNDATVSLRLTVARIIPASGWGCFSLNPSHQEPRNAYLSQTTLQKALKQPGRVNVIIVSARDNALGGDASAETARLQRIVAQHVGLSDFGLRLRHDDGRGYAALESDGLLLTPAVEIASFAAARDVGVIPMPVLTYLANTISVEPPETLPSRPSSASRPPAPAAPREIPYSTVTAIQFDHTASLSSLTLLDGRPAAAPGEDGILLNDWAAADLEARVGDRIRLRYYAMGAFGQLQTQEAAFRLSGVVQMRGLADDPGLTPQYEGVTNAKHLSDWDPPFPIDFGRVRPKDESYWDAHRVTPKAFISLQRGQALWAKDSQRFGRLTQIRFAPGPGRSLAATATDFERALLSHLAPDKMGLAFEPVKSQAITASRGSTDFSMLFMAFSVFLIASSAMLVALVFRLGIEKRSSEVGLLLAVGFRPRGLTLALLAEGATLTGIGAAIGLVGALAYARLLLAGLESWWSDAASVPALHLHAQPPSLIIGFIASSAVALASIAWAIRGLSRISPRSLLAGGCETAMGPALRRRSRLPQLIALLALAAAATLLTLAISTDAIPQTAAFFGSGAAIFVASLSSLLVWTRMARHRVIAGNGPMAVARLGIRNAARNSRRSLLTAGLIASATFIVITVGANRQDIDADSLSKWSGTGGFPLVAQSTVPVLQDINTSEGREALSLSQTTRTALSHAKVVPFRLHSGDEASCLSLYQPRRPRILGATSAMIDRGGFRFKETLARTNEETRNPWLLLTQRLPDGAIPAIGDDNTVTWLLHLGLGNDLTFTDDRGREARLRIVGLLSGSILQGGLVVAEPRLVELFPSSSGYGFFLIEGTATRELGTALERDLARYGFEATPATERLARYLAVENAYLSAFQTLGGLGLILGTFGLAAVLLRSIMERRGELALLQALGWRRATLAWLVLTENASLLLWGLAVGTLSAVLAVAPHALSNARQVPWISLGLTLFVVFLTGTASASLAIIVAMRSPLLPSLRSE
jgi:putative ABC transport system permease protein